MARRLFAPGVRIYFAGVAVGWVISFLEAPLQAAVYDDPLLWLPWLVYAAASVVWTLSLFTSQEVRSWLFLLGLLPALPLNLVYLFLLYPIHLIPVVFFSIGIARSFDAVGRKDRPYDRRPT
jgi:hypothetical protein